MKKIIGFFLQGLLLVGPLGITVYIIYNIVTFSDRLAKWIFPDLGMSFTGFGIVAFFVVLSGLGILSKLFFIKPIINLFNRLLNEIPLVKIIYSAIKDLFSAFMGDEKKFDTPVLIDWGSDGRKRLGFLTSENPMLVEGEEEKLVTVYIPHSYNFSGNFYFVPHDKVKVLHGYSSSDVMKFAVSGGIAEIENEGDE